jgi:8-oxo-dGTP diphosphatase
VKGEITVTAGLLRRDGRILIAQRAEEKHQERWEFPGGKVEEGESAAESLERELREELNLEVKAGALFCESYCRAGEKSIRLLTFEVEQFFGEIRCLVHKQLQWADIKDLRNYQFLPADVPVVDKLLAEHR